MSKRDAGKLGDSRQVIQLFRAQGRNLACLSPVFATYRQEVIGTVTATLYRVDDTEARFRERVTQRASAAAGLIGRLTALIGLRDRIDLGTILAECTIDCAEVTDNEAIALPFGSLDITPGELLALRIRAAGPSTEARPTIWLTDSAERIPGHVACYINRQDQGALGIEASAFQGARISELQGPQQILYSPISQCNLNCIHCISRHTRKTVNKLAAPIKEQLREWCATGQVNSIITDYSGDILWAETRFGGELDFLFGLGVPLHIDTNGACLTAEISERLCHSPLASLNISLDAADPATYQRVRKGAPPLDEVVANIEGLLRIRAAAGATFPVSISMTLMRTTLGEWPDFLRLGARLGVNFVHARHLEAYFEDMETDSLWNDRAAYNAARPEALTLAEELGIQIGAPLPFSGKAVTGRRPCTIPWESAVMLGNGDVQACCVPGTLMGNLHESTMEEIWNGPRYQALRATVNSANPMPACATCPMFRRTDNPDSYLIYSATRRLTGARPAA